MDHFLAVIAPELSKENSNSKRKVDKNYNAESCRSCTISEILGAQNAGQGNLTDP
jgi:hypothetical protein